MKRILSALLCVMLLVSMTACGSRQKDEQKSLEAAVAAYAAANAEQYAFEVAKTLSYDEKLLTNAYGYRTAGSDAEHAAADWIAEEMARIGLVEIEKIPVTVDLFQFNGASLTMEGTDIDIFPASYQVSGTDTDGITAEIVDLGTGFAEDYVGVDVKGKIALVGVDQWNESWISGYMAEAYAHGAAAVVSYDIGGYGSYNDDQINVQDVCQLDLLPTVAISVNQYKEIREALDNGHHTATLIVDNVYAPEEGISYNVAGRIKGKSSDQQIIVSGHYDVYFNGFQDDSCAIGLALGIAKTMLDSGFQPENDIVFVAHGSEEWGAEGTEFDWTTGAWELINHVKADWAAKTIALINFELPALYDGAAQDDIRCVPEYAGVVHDLVNSGLLPMVSNGVFPDGYSDEAIFVTTMEDGISYRFAGVPYFLNGTGMRATADGWYQQHYHTPSDDESTYNADVMATNINLYGILAMYIDSMPAMMTDFTATADELTAAVDEDIMTMAGADLEGYNAALTAFRAAAEQHSAQVAAINAKGMSASKEGKKLNEKSLAIFKAIQDGLIGVIASSDVVIKHIGYQENIAVLSQIVTMLENNDPSAAESAYLLNGMKEYCAYIFGPETVANAVGSMRNWDPEQENMFWGTGKGYRDTGTSEATASMLMKIYAGEYEFAEELAVYRAALEQQLALYRETVASEVEWMNTITGMFGS